MSTIFLFLVLLQGEPNIDGVPADLKPGAGAAKELLAAPADPAAAAPSGQPAEPRHQLWCVTAQRNRAIRPLLLPLLR